MEEHVISQTALAALNFFKFSTFHFLSFQFRFQFKIIWNQSSSNSLFFNSLLPDPDMNALKFVFHKLPILFLLNFKSNLASYRFTGWRNTIYFSERWSCLISDMLLEYIFYLWLSHKKSLSLEVIVHTELNESFLLLHLSVVFDVRWGWTTP